jgi:hypothetical protein
MSRRKKVIRLTETQLHQVIQRIVKEETNKKMTKLKESDIHRMVKRVLTEQVAKKLLDQFKSKKYTFTADNANQVYEWDVKQISNDIPFYITVVDKALLKYKNGGQICGGNLELTLNPNGKWVIYPASVHCNKKTQQQFLKFTKGGLKQDELASLVGDLNEKDFKSSIKDMDNEGLADPGEPTF